MTVGIKEILVRNKADGNTLKFQITLTDGTEYKINASQIEGKTEEELNAALDLWLSVNRPELLGLVAVHLEPDGTLYALTGDPPAWNPPAEFE